MKIVYVCGTEEWEAIYIDDKKEDENSILHIDNLLYALLGHPGKPISEISKKYVDQQWLNDHNFPDNLSDIPQEVLTNETISNK